MLLLQLDVVLTQQIWTIVDRHLHNTFNTITDCPPTETSQIPTGETSTGIGKIIAAGGEQVK